MIKLKGFLTIILALTVGLSGCTFFSSEESSTKEPAMAGVKKDQGPKENEESGEVEEKKSLDITFNDSLQSNLAATVNGEEISIEDFERRVQKSQYVLVAQGYDFQTNREHAIEELRRMVINELVYEKVLMQIADEMGATASEGEVEDVINSIKANFTPEEYKEILKSRGITEENQRTYNRIQLTKANLQVIFGNQEQMLKHIEERVYSSAIIVNEPAVDQLLQNI